ncbi:MAG: tRNA (adenine-N1)-methyltransferase [Nitrososphaeraceae archaeon]
MKIKESSYVILFYSSRKKWLVKVESGKEFHTHLGIIRMDEVIDSEYGKSVKTNLDKTIYLIEPTIYDFVMKSERHTQIVYPKDLGFIVIRSGITNGSKVVEIGTGSAALTTYIASIVKPNGHVYTFDVNPKFMEVAKKNLVKANMLEYVSMNKYDVHLGLDLVDIDSVIVDLGDPWTVVEPLYKILKGSGSFLAICPTMNQLEKTSIALKENHFIDIESVELFIRNIEAREGMSRPSMRMIGHTTYLIFARKSITNQ